MASSLPNPTEVAGKHHQIYEAYYRQLDPKNVGTIEAVVAAKFLKKSSLSDVVLSRVWDLSDPTGKGYLDKAGLFVALKLIGLAQTGDTINMKNILNELPNPPKVGEIPKISPPKIQSIPPNSNDWSIRPVDKLKYEELFESLMPSDGLLPGAKVRNVLMDSNLPLDALSKIWDLADQDRDGSLDKHEFIIAMHLVYLALDKRSIPQTLPTELQRSTQKSTNDNGFVANFPSDIGPPPVPPLPVIANKIAPAIPPMPQLANRQNNVPSMQPLISMTDSLLGSPPNSSDWVVTPNDRVRFDGIFARSDLDKDGLVSGHEIKDIFMQSGIPQMCLAQIWALCDTNQSGKLTMEQFALAMWLVERKKNGIEPPNVLAPNMIPPSLRTAPMSNVSALTSLIGDSIIAPIQPIEPTRPVYSNPELEMIAKEIEELAKERRQLENEVSQKEADIRIKNGEVRSLQNEHETLAATLKQLENQKGEAQKRLNDLKAQVTKIREQCQKQEETIREQETELDSKKGELQKLKDEESTLEKEYEENKRLLDKLSQTLQDTQLQICQIKALVSQLEENQKQMNEALDMCKSAIEASDPSQVSYFALKIEPDFRDAQKALEVKTEPAKDPFNDKSNGFSNGTSDNEFKADKFATTFDDNSTGFSSGFDEGFGGGFSKPNNDPFASNSTGSHDPFGDKTTNSGSHDPNKDDFGSDPFAILHAPTSASQALSPGHKSGPPPRPESPSPALPPKKAKQPPPRPAPPRPTQGPGVSKPDSGFGGGSGFANFADFDNKSSGLGDFAEDPFKDYRYEDPFNIEDPFADTEDAKDKHNKKIIEMSSVFKAIDDGLHSDATNNHSKLTVNNINNINNNKNNDNANNNNNNDIILDKNQIVNKKSSSMHSTTSHGTENGKQMTIHEQQQQQFDNFANFDDFPTPKSKFIAHETDFFAEFNDNFAKSKLSTMDSNDAFGDFGLNSTRIDEGGIGGSLTQKLSTSNLTSNFDITNSTTITTKLTNRLNSDDKFATSFVTNSNVDKQNNNNNVITGDNKLDAFGFDDGEFADFNSAFDALNFQSNEKSSSTTATKITTTTTKAVNKLKPIQSTDFTSFSNKKFGNGNGGGGGGGTDTTDIVKLPTKFASDYSNADVFEDDLQKVLQRSLADQ